MSTQDDEAGRGESEQKREDDAAASHDCPDCEGAGEVDGEPCFNCGGTGKAVTEFS